jgi:hypothetical protein
LAASLKESRGEVAGLANVVTALKHNLAQEKKNVAELQNTINKDLRCGISPDQVFTNDK